METRKYFQSGPLTLSYVDFGGASDRILLCLHGHFGAARMFSDLASRLQNWRVIGLDQRGHGWSDHPVNRDYSRESYISDIHQLIMNELHGKPVTMLGHSLGGVNTYQFAARYPELVNAMIIEDIGAETKDDLSFSNAFPKYTSTLIELKKSLHQLGLKGFDYFAESAYETEEGWTFRFDRKGMAISQQQLNGNWWKDWTKTSCPALLLHGKKSWVVDEEQIKTMTIKRPNTQYVIFKEAGHNIHDDDPETFSNAVIQFLDSSFMS